MKAVAEKNTNASRQAGRSMSTYRADSEVSRINATGARLTVRISAPSRSVFDEAFRVGALSGGAFYITVGPLVELWRFGTASRAEAVRPSADPDHLSQGDERPQWVNIV